MNPQETVGLLCASFSGDTALRKAAETKITELCRMPGAAAMLLHVATSQVQREARQAASIALKNLVKRRWGEDELFSVEEQASARTVTFSAKIKFRYSATSFFIF